MPNPRAPDWVMVPYLDARKPELLRLADAASDHTGLPVKGATVRALKSYLAAARAHYWGQQQRPARPSPPAASRTSILPAAEVNAFLRSLPPVPFA